MKINTKQGIKDLAGKDIANGKDGIFTVGLALSNILLDAKTGGRMKLFILAQKCFDAKEIEVDNADLQLIKDSVEKTEQYNNLVNGQLLQILNEIKKESPSEDK